MSNNFEQLVYSSFLPLQIRVIWCIEVCFSQKKRNSRVCTLDYIENFWLVILNPYLNSAINFEATPFVVNDETPRLLGISVV